MISTGSVPWCSRRLRLLHTHSSSRVRPFIPTANDPLVELDRNGRKFDLCIEHSEPILNVIDLKEFLLCTCNLDPYLNKLIRGTYAWPG